MLLKRKQAVLEAVRLDRPGLRDLLCLDGKPTDRSENLCPIQIGRIGPLNCG